MGKVKLKVNGDEKSELLGIKKAIKEQQVRQKWNHIFKKIYVRNGQNSKMNRSNGDVSDVVLKEHEEKEELNGKKKQQEPVESPEKPEIQEIEQTTERTTKINGKKIITDPIPSTSTGITANGRGKRKWETISYGSYNNGMIGRKHPRIYNGFPRQNYEEDSSLDETSSDYDNMANGEFDLSSDIHYEGSTTSESEDERQMAELMAYHEMQKKQQQMEDSEYDEEYCSEEESLDEEYDDEEASYDDEDLSYDSDEIESEYFSDSENSHDSVEVVDPDDYHHYEGTSSDTDYDPGEDFIEDLYVARGTAVTYSAKEITNYLPFSEDTDEPQVIDITDMVTEENSNSNSSCPKLVPIKGVKGSEESSRTSADDSNSNQNGPIFTVDDISSSSDDVSVISVAKTSSDEEIDENCMNIDTKDDFMLSNSLNNNSPSCLLHLKKPIYVNGVVDVELLAGNAQIFGYNLPLKGSQDNATQQIISARGYKLINITPEESMGDEKQIKLIIESLKDTFPKQDLDVIAKNFDSKLHALLLLSRSKINTKIKVVKKFTSGRYLFPEAATIGQRNNHYLSEAILNTKIFTEASCKRPLKLLDQWKDFTPDATSRTLIVGGKNVGKSTFAEHLINKSLSEHSKQRVLLIDLDIGQPILFVPQVVSAILVDKPILGNGVLSECGTVLKSFIFGDINVMLSPIKYIKCVKELLECCSQDEMLKNIPWIINTMGFQKGLGVELMAAVIKMTNPTKVVQIQHDIENFNFRNVMNENFVNNFTFNMFKEEIEDCKLAKKRVSYEVIEMPSAMNDVQMDTNATTKKQEDPSLLPAEKRTIMMLAHLTDLKGEYEWITDATPYVITNPQITIASSEKIPKNHELETINGNIVYLCHSSSITCPNQSQIHECFGIGLIRAIDIKNNLAYVHHSISRNKMHAVNLLVLANITPPKDIFLKQSNKIKGSIPNLYNTDAEFAGSRKIGRGNNI